MTSVGTGYVDIRPAFDDFNRELAGVFQRAGRDASADFTRAFDGRRAGEDASRDFTQGLGDGREAARAGDRAGDRFGDGFQDSAEQAGGGIKATFAKIGKAASAAAVAATAGLGVGIGKALEREGLNAKLAGQLDLNGDQAARAGQIAGSVYAGNYGESLDEVNNAIRSLAQNTGVALDGGNIEGFSKKLLNLSSAFGTDSDEVTRSINSLVSNGLAPNIDAAFDLVTRGFQKGADRGGEFLDTLNEYADPVRQIGLSAADFTGSISRGFDAGVFSADKLGDAVKEFSIRAIDGSDTTKDAFDELGLNYASMSKKFATGGPAAREAFSEVIGGLEGIKDPLKQEAAGVALFGAQFEDIGLKGIKALAPVETGLGKVDGAANRLDTTLGTTSGATLEAFKRKATLALGDAGAAAIRTGQALSVKLAPAFETVKRAFSGVVAFVQANFPKLSAIVSRVVASIGGFLRRNRVEIRQVGQAFQNIGTAVRAVFQSVVIPIIRRALPAIRSALGGIITIARGVIRIFSGIFTGDFSRIWQGVKDIVRGAIRGVIAFLRLQVGSLKAVGRLIGAGVKAGIKAGLQGIVGLGKGIINGLISVLNTGFKAVNDFIPDKIKLPGPVPDIDLPNAVIPEIPKLARGGLTTGRTLAEIGEDGQEVVLPLKASVLSTVGRAIAPSVQAAAAAGDGGGLVIHNTFHIVSATPDLTGARVKKQIAEIAIEGLNRKIGRQR